MDVTAPASDAIIENRIFDEIAIGDSPASTRTLTEEDIELFAGVSGDVNPAHLDPGYAETDLFHKILAHGMWSGALSSAVLGTKLPGPGTIYLSQYRHFHAPIGIGDTITTTVMGREKAEKQRIVLHFRCLNQLGREVVSGAAEVQAPATKLRQPRIELPEVRLMGFTALDGLMMGTRCGSIDAGVLLYMLQQKHLSPQQVEQVLYRQSGLLGVSGLSSGMRELLASSAAHAREAEELFVYRIAREAAALAGALGGLDCLVFTAAIGEHAAEIRAAECERLEWLAVVPDAAANARHATCISTPDSRVRMLVVPTDEERMIAGHTLGTLDA
ncbi:MAG TPA: MaoC/PaaZ C-terminal domain-containing protein [Acetobacteraceae bacterium]|nr:MaoC/PaaZ C-terminal domain-containing protein [Acetobacteraceae bacterium]